jgi:hypothetical protein
VASGLVCLDLRLLSPSVSMLWLGSRALAFNGITNAKSLSAFDVSLC